MSTQKKVVVGLAVLLGLALLAPTFTAYANRQREGAEAGALTEAQRQMQRDAEAARWQAMGEWYRSQAAAAPVESDTIMPVYDSTGAMLEALAVEPVAAPSTHYAVVDSATASQLAAEHPWTSGDPSPVYDATGARLDALRPEPAPTAYTPTVVIDWAEVQAKMTAVPGYDPSQPVPTVVPQGP